MAPTWVPASRLLPWIPALTSFDDGQWYGIGNWNKPFLLPVACHHGVYQSIERKSEYHRIILSEIMVAWVFSSFLSEYLISKWLSFGRTLLLLVPQLVSLVLGVQWWQCWKAPAVTQATYVMCSEAIKGMNNGVCTSQTCGELGWHWCHLASRKVDQRL